MIQNWRHIRALLQHWLVGLCAIVGYFFVANVFCGQGDCTLATTTNFAIAGLALVMIVCLRTAYQLTRASTLLLFTPLLSFSASAALFFGFGPMSVFLAGEDTLRFQQSSIYAVRPEQVLETSLLTCVGLAVSVAGLLLALPRQAELLRSRPTFALHWIALIFIGAGLVLKHGIVMPSIYGTSDFFVPGVLRNLRYLPDLGFSLLALVAARSGVRWTVIFWVLWAPHFLLAFPEFSKKSVMLTMLLPAIGDFIGRRSYKRLAVWVLAAMLIFGWLQNANAVGRWAQNEAEQHREQLDVRARFEILLEVSQAGRNVDRFLPYNKVGVETWWLRLNYAGPQAEAMRLHDAGISSTFTQNPLIFFVPRVLWPDKPKVINPGREFHADVTGNSWTETKVGITVFADGYWQMGWFGVVLFSLILGLVFGTITRLTMRQLGEGRFLYLPSAMFGLQMGATGPTAFLQNAIISGLPIYIGFTLVVGGIYIALERGLFSGRPRPARAVQDGAPA